MSSDSLPSSIDNLSSSSLDCHYEEPAYLTERFIIVTGFGTFLALISVLENSFLSFLLLRRSSHRSSYLLYLGLLAVCDVFISIAYIPLMSLNMLADMMRLSILLKAWFHYMIPMITISHIAMTASSFLIVAMTFERYSLTVSSHMVKYLHMNRTKIAAFVIFFGFLTKISMAAELSITYNEECKGTMSEYSLSLSTLATNTFYNSVWRFFARTCITVYIPFFVLFFLNTKIILYIWKNKNIQRVDDSNVKRKTRVREATFSHIMIVFGYLISNVLNVVVTIWEYYDIENLQIKHGVFYIFAVDIVSLLTVLAGSLRLPTYLICQSQLRTEVFQLIRDIIKGPNEKYDETSIHPPLFNKDEEKDEESSSSNLLPSSPIHPIPLLSNK